MFTRTRWRLVGWSVLVLGLIILVVGGTVYVTLSRSLTAEVDRNLASRAEQVANNIRDLGESDLRLGREGYRGGLFYLVASPDGHVLANPQGVSLGNPPLNLGADAIRPFSTVTLDGDPVRLHIRPLGGRRPPLALLVVGQSMLPEQETLHRLLVVLLITGGAGLLLAILGGWFLAGRALVPIATAFDRQQQFVADASHELRTPLTVLRSATDLLNQHRQEPLEASGELFDDVRQEIARLERLSNDLLSLARSDLGELVLATGQLDLSATATEVVRRTLPLARQHDIALTCQAYGEPLYVEGDPDRLQQVLLILLDNAIKHTPDSGSVVVAVKKHDTDVILQVTDSGEGIPAEHLPRVFDRFYRVDRARSQEQGSTGLGLAIAKSLVEAHGGQLLLSSRLGEGTTATIRLRLTDQPLSFTDRLGQLATRIAHRPL